MKLKKLRHGEVFTLLLSPAHGGTLSPHPAVGDEIRLIFPRSDDQALLNINGRVSEYIGVDDVARRRLKTLRQVDPARLCWLAQVEDRSGTTELTVLVHRFKSTIRWDSELVLGVDDRIVERVSKHARKTLTVEETCKWLSDQVLIPGTDGFVRIVATGAPDKGGRFRLLGRWVGVDIAPKGDNLLVESVVQIRADRQGFRPPEFLIEAQVTFTDITAATLVRQSVRSQLERIVAESDNSYLALWQRYQDLEKQQLVRKAKELGWVEYTEFRNLPSGLWAFKARSKQQLSEFLSQMRVEDQELEAGAKLPNELLDVQREEKESSGDRPFVGIIERVLQDIGELHLRPFDEDSDSVAPKRGFLFGALQGDRKRLRRREDAVKRLSSADARLPQLALIIEDEPAPMRRTDKVRPLSEEALKLFEHPPTPAQRDAIDKALNTPDIALIQGPPGTGKTTVIAALQVRLTQLEAERPEIAGRTLLTSYQHDAVDNAVERSEVFGLPPARFGGKRGSRSVNDQAARWAIEARERIQGRLAVLEEDRPRALYKEYRDRVAVYAAGHLPEEEVNKLLDDLLELPADTLPSDLWEKLQRLRRRPGSGAGLDDLEQELAKKAVRGIRTTPAAFSDDGPARARRALRGLKDLLKPEERELLEAAAAVEPGGDFTRINELGPLRDALLDRMSPDHVPGDRRQRDPEIMEALNMVVAALFSRVERGLGGVADALQEYAEALHTTPGEVIRTLRHYSAVYAATCQQAVGRAVAEVLGLNSSLEFENVVVDEAARANPLDLFIPMSLARRRVILVGDHRQLPHMLEPDIERELSESANEATQKALKSSLFERLYDDLRRREQSDGVLRVVTLDKQFRMHPVLGRFVSEVFYEDYREGFESPLPAKNFVHNLDRWKKADAPVCAAWQHIPLKAGKERRVGTSWARPEEARWIASTVRELLEGQAHDLNIGVITFYTAQVNAILEAMLDEGLSVRDPDTGALDVAPRWRTLERKGKREEWLRVGTVDAFQGMEFDLVFLSVVRSNPLVPEGEAQLRRKFGHLLLPNRLCVAMSRQKRLLVAVGDKAMFENKEGVAEREVPGLAKFLELCGGEHGLVS